MSHRLKSIDAFSHQGFKGVGAPNHYNEDRLVTGTNLFAVIDGATALVDADMGGLNPSAYTSQFLAAFLMKNDDPADPRSAKDLLIDANIAFRQHLKEDWPHILELGKLGPCCAVALIKIHNDGMISHANLADCSILVLQNNQWHMVSKFWPCHAELDQQLADAIFAEIHKGASIAEAKKAPHIQEHLKKGRQLANIDYGFFNADEAVKDFIKYGTLQSKDAEAIIVMSDGLFWPESSSHEQASLTAAKKIYEQGVYGYYQDFKALYDADPNFQRFPRFKHMDDATALFIKL